MRLKWNRLLVLPLIIAVVGVWLLWPHSNPKAGWFDDNWGYRVAISIGNTGSADGNKKVKLDIDTAALITAGKIQSDCGDSRFTDATGKILRYYIDTVGGACNTSSTDYYLLMPSIPAGGIIIYHYYGNPNVINGTETAQFSQSTFTPNSGPTAASEEQSTGPVLSWSINEVSGSTLNDDTLYANSGTLGTTTSAPTWAATDQCISGSCLKFDGTNDYVSRTYSSDTELNPGTSGFSVSAWFKHTSVQAGTDVIISRVDGADANGIGYKIYMDSSGYICFGIDQTAGSFPVDSACSTTSYADSKWHHVSGVKNGTTSVILYIDGQQIAADTSITASSISGSSPAFRVGIDNGGANPWDGFIDAVKVYPYARSSDQIKTDFISRGSVKGVGIQMGNSDMNKSLSTGLVGYWKMDEGTGQSLTDYSANATTGQLGSTSGSDTSDPSFSTGKFGYGLNFDGTNDYVIADISSSKFPFVQTEQILKNGSFSFWYKTGSNISTANSGILSTGRTVTEGQPSLLIQNNAGTLRAYAQSADASGAYFGSYTLSTNTWYYITVVADATKYYLYVNTALVATIDINLAPGLPGYRNNLYIGTGYNDYAIETIDELRIYNRALSTAEISTLYNWAPGPVVYLNLNEGSGTTLKDSSGNSFSGNLSTASWSNGKFGKGLSFGGANNSAYITDNDTFTSQNITLSAWVKNEMAADSDYGEIIAKGSHGTGEYSIRLSRIGFYCDINGNNTNSVSGLTLDKNWHHIACTYDSSNIRFYIDGILLKTIALSTTLSNSSYDITIGEDGLGGFDFTGKIDDVRIYNYTRTPAQIIEDMNASHPIGGSPIGSQVSYWKFDEGSLNTCSGGTNDFCDSSINANDLAFSGTAGGITLSGKYGKAFDGNAARWASRADDDDFDFAAADDFTLTAWIKTDGTASGTQYILNKSSATAQGYGIYGSSSGKVVFAIDDDTSWTPDDQAQSTTNIFDQAWHYIAARKTGTSKIDIFVDGRLEGSDTSLGATGSLSNAVSFYVGDRDGTDNGDEFNGDVDEVKIYRAALTDDQIKLDFNQGQSTVMGAISTASNGITADNSSARAFCIPGDTSTCNPPVGWYKMDEGSGTSNTYDSSGNNDTGTMNGGMTHSNWVAGKNGKALRFDGTNDYILVTNPSALSNLPPNNFSASAWIKLNSLPATNTGYIIAGKSRNDDHIWHFDVVNISGTVYFDASLKNNAISRTTGVSTGVWYHYYITYNNSTDRKIHQYINGSEVSYTTQSAFSGTYGTDATYDSNNDFAIGAHKNNTSYFNGIIDDLRIYDYVRTPAQVAWDYNNGGPVAWYRFDECQGTTAYDSAPNYNVDITGNNGTITIGATGPNTSAGTCTGASTEAWKNGVNGKIKSSLSFDGTDDYVSITDNSTLDVTGELSVAAWIKITSAFTGDGGEVILGKYGAAGQRSYMIYIDGSGTNSSILYFLVSADGTNIAQSCKAGNAITWNQNQWYHVAGVFSPSSRLEVYRDGQLIPCTPDAPIPSAVFNSTSDLRIGTATGYNYPFHGLIDDVRIFNYALTGKQIKTIMNNNSAVNFAPTTGSP